MPGMGLTAIGLAGVVISYAEIAHTFIDGMHALTGLTMFFGLIFLAAGILEGGVSTSNKAKATTLVILGISLSFGMVGVAASTISTIPLFAGIMMIIAIPAILIAYVYMKFPSYAKPVSIIFLLAAAAGISAYIAFGLIGPEPYLLPHEEVEEEVVEEAAEVSPDTPVLSILILPNSDQQGNPDYDPDAVDVPSGMIIKWTNQDDVPHTVTSSVDFGETFDSGLMDPGAEFFFDSSALALGEYEYLCIVHPWMISTITVVEAVEAETVTVSIPEGAGNAPAAPGDSSIEELTQEYYVPQDISVSVGTTVAWDNEDSVMHTVTSGTPDNGPDGKFDSSILNAGETFEHTFTTAETVDYYCIVHPWMIGSVTVG